MQILKIGLQVRFVVLPPNKKQTTSVKQNNELRHDPSVPDAATALHTRFMRRGWRSAPWTTQPVYSGSGLFLQSEELRLQ